MNSNAPQPIVVPPDSGKVLKFLGVTHKLTPQQTDSSYYLFEFEFDPEVAGRMHIHHYEDEIIYVLEGAIGVKLGDQALRADTGGVIHLPKHVPHALYNPLKEPSKYLGLTIPAGLENFFDEVAETQASGALDDSTFANVSQKYGLEWLE